MLINIDTSAIVFKVFIVLVANLVLAMFVMGYARADDKARYVKRCCAVCLLLTCSVALYFSLSLSPGPATVVQTQVVR